MRIAIVHSFYRTSQPSGENAIVLAQIEALKDRGHEVLLVARHTDDELMNPWYPMKAALRTITGRGPSPIEELLAFDPECIHVHNLFPGFGTSWLAEWPGRVVATLHNFRPVCANGLLYRDGRYCDDCQSKHWTQGVRGRCYHNSAVATLPLAVRNARGLGGDALIARADALVVLSQAAADIYAKFGLPLEKTHVVPNGIPEPHLTIRQERGSWVAAGRLTPEKGFVELAAAWPETETLSIYGDGPQRTTLELCGRQGVNLQGAVSRDALLEALAEARGLIVPSRCLDSQPTVVLEALAVGTPVIAWRGNSVSRLVQNEACGAVYESDNEIAGALRFVRENQGLLSARSRSVFMRHFHIDRWVARLESLYAQ